MTVANSVYREPNSRQYSVWLPNELMDYVTRVGEELGVPRNRALRMIIEEHRQRRQKRTAKKL